MRETDHAITSRRSVRRFLPTPVPRAMVENILDVAARAPSGTNMQPWRARVLTGEPKRLLCEAVHAVFMAGEPGHTQEYPYYPDEFFEPYLSRRRAVGWGLYGLLGIKRGETEKMKAQHGRNYLFFDAPVGMIFTIDRRLALGSWLDYGMFLQNVMVAARARGLDTCPQVAWTHYHKVIRRVLELEPEEAIVCGMALGYADQDAPENALVTDRAKAAEFAAFSGFEEEA
ncbi:MAG TPA: nitroreductase [Acetobacteraceae bacterium]|nr:nitroreductase [Acetobacteraceae bacterium]